MSQKSLRYTRLSAYTLLLAAVFAFQTVFAADMRISGVAPMLLIPATLCVGMFSGEKAGAVFGLILGLACDATAGQIMGYYALTLTLTGFLAGLYTVYVAQLKLTAAFVFHLVVYLITAALSFFIYFFFLGDLSIIPETYKTLGTEFLYSLLFLPVFYGLCLLLNKRYAKEEE